jgi:thiamine-monophosphate kinase
MTVSDSFTPISDVGEFGLIGRLEALLAPHVSDTVIQGIGDDAAVYRTDGSMVQIVTTDALIESVHFDRTFMPMRHLGFKAISVNVSDILAMNGTPRYATIAVGLPHNVSVEMAESMYQGIAEACEQFGLGVIGGDTTAAHRLTVSVTVIGEAPEERVVYRHGAKPGDLICVTGDLGSSYAGLKVLLDQKKRMEDGEGDFQSDLEEFPYVLRRHLRPVARWDAVRRWEEAEFRPSALIDISDGLSSEVHHLCRRSGVGALIHGATLPIDLETRNVADRFAEDVDTFALFGGEDYELLFATTEEHIGLLDAGSYTVIGHFTEAEEGVRLRLPEGETVRLESQGYTHFQG